LRTANILLFEFIFTWQL